MEPDEGRIDAKTKDAEVIDLAEVREQRERTGVTMKYLDPVKSATMKFWILLAVAVVLLVFLRKRRS